MMNSGSLSVSMNDLPNLPGIRRDISAANPKLYREFKASQGGVGFGSLETTSRASTANPATNNNAGYTPVGTPYTPVEGEDSLMAYFENQNKLMEYSKSLQSFPAQGGAYNDITGRYRYSTFSIFFGSLSMQLRSPHHKLLIILTLFHIFDSPIFSLRSQQQDRLSKSRSLPYCRLDSAPAFVSNSKRVCRFLAYFTGMYDIFFCGSFYRFLFSINLSHFYFKKFLFSLTFPLFIRICAS